MDREQLLTFNEKIIAEFRESDGYIPSLVAAPYLLLTTTGARSGRPHTSPMMYLADEEDPYRIYVFASASGADRNPAWFHNVVANPEGLRVEIGTETMTADAEVLPDPERTEVYAVQATRFPIFAAYQARTDRPIPVVALTLHAG